MAVTKITAECCLRDEGLGWQEVEWVLEEEGEERKEVEWQRFAMFVCNCFRSLGFPPSFTEDEEEFRP